MKKLNADVVIIGAGSAGMTAYQAARRESENIFLIESEHYGTTCARVGCMPSKLLIAAAERTHQINQADQFGIHLEGGVRVDGREVMKRVRSERDRFASSAAKSVESYPEAHRLWGHASFVSPNQIAIDDHTLIQTRATVIATGSTPHRLPMFAAAGERLIVNDDLFDWETLPESVAVFGPGVIGLELGQALHRLNVRVRLFGVGGAVGPISDEKIRASTLSIFENEFYIDPDAEVVSIAEVEDQVEIKFKDRAGKVCTERFDYLLAATGRTPRIHDLGLENTGLTLNERGMPEFDINTMQCGDSAIFIAGDANGFRPLLHEAADEGRIAGRNAVRFPNVQPVARRSALSVVFTDPQIALVGAMYRDLVEGEFAVGEFSFQRQSRARMMGANQGLLRLYGEYETRRFLGAEMVVPAAEHLAHLLAWSHQQELTVDEMLALPFYHPVLEEGVRSALQALSRALRER